VGEGGIPVNDSAVDRAAGYSRWSFCKQGQVAAVGLLVRLLNAFTRRDIRQDSIDKTRSADFMTRSPTIMKANPLTILWLNPIVNVGNLARTENLLIDLTNPSLADGMYLAWPRIRVPGAKVLCVEPEKARQVRGYIGRPSVVDVQVTSERLVNSC